MTRARAAMLALVFLGASVVVEAEIPVRTEQVIWSVLAWNGRDYSGTFVPESSGTLSLLAGVDSFLSARATLVYWWPATMDWRTDTETLNIQYPGELELSDAAGRSSRLPLQEYTYFNVRGEYELNWKVLTGLAARAEIERYAQIYDAYLKEVQAYRLAASTHEEEVQELAAQIQRRKDAGSDYSALLDRLRDAEPPAAPPVPDAYVVPPAEMQRAFIVNLPVGRYTIRLVNPDGSIMENTDKVLEVHDRTRTGGVGYELIPGDKWTRSESSATPSAVIYVSGAADLYLRPYFEDEYNDLAYERTVSNGARGNPNIAKWVRVQQVPRAVIELAGSTTALLAESRFLVEQNPGNSLGYTITPFDPAGAHRDKTANLIAHRVELTPGTPNLRLRALDETGRPLAGSERQIRVVGPMAAAPLLLGVALLPLLAMALIRLARRRRYTAERLSD